MDVFYNQHCEASKYHSGIRQRKYTRKGQETQSDQKSRDEDEDCERGAYITDAGPLNRDVWLNIRDPGAAERENQGKQMSANELPT
jgi:hypothetical protein